MAQYSSPSEAELADLLNKTFTNETRTGYISIKDFVIPNLYQKFEKRINDFEIRDTDIWICGFPKTGTTWISEISWLIANNLDYEGAKVEEWNRTILFDLNILVDLEKGALGNMSVYDNDSIEFSQKLKSPRSLKSHLPLFLLPDELKNGTKKPKIIYTARHPMDVCVSYYYQCANIENFTGTFEEFCKLFLFNKINYGPCYKHVVSFWEAKHNLNILFLTYEEMHKDISAVIRKVARFLNKRLTDKEVTCLQQYVSFESMKNNPSVNREEAFDKMRKAGLKVHAPFIRSGKVRGFKSHMSEEFISKFEYWMQRWFEETGIDFTNIENYIFDRKI